MSRWRGTSLILMAAASAIVASCTATTEPSSTELTRQRAQWTALKPAAYRYDFKVVGFFISYEGKRIRLEVRDGIVRSATDLATGAPMSGNASDFPTIDGLFDRAMHAAEIGTLVTAKYDPAFGFPTEFRVSGVPDGAGTYFADSLRRVDP